MDFADAAKLAHGELLLSPLPAHVTNDCPRSAILGSGVEDGSALKLAHLHVESRARHVRDVGRCPAATEAQDVLEELHLSRLRHLRARFVIAEQQVALGVLAVRWREKSPVGVCQKQRMCRFCKLLTGGAYLGHKLEIHEALVQVLHGGRSLGPFRRQDGGRGGRGRHHAQVAQVRLRRVKQSPQVGARALFRFKLYLDQRN